MNTNFPEDLFEIDSDKLANYEYITQRGIQIAKNKTIIFCGICRNVENVLQLNIDRIHRTGLNFKDYSVFIYENDSTDKTVEILNKNKSNKINFLSEHREDKDYAKKLDTIHDPWHYNRCCVLSECRNKYIDHIKQLDIKPDYVCVLDLDIKGGWSYNGFYHSIFIIEQDQNFGCISAYGVLANPSGTEMLDSNNIATALMYDSFAFRPYGWNSAVHMISTPLFNNIKLNKNMEPFLVESNFGGMAIYKTQAFLDGDKYEAKNWAYKNSPFVDPDHVHLHRNMQTKNWKILINPSFIVSYSDHKFSISKDEKNNVNYVSN